MRSRINAAAGRYLFDDRWQGKIILVNAAAGRYLFDDRWQGKIILVNAPAGVILSIMKVKEKSFQLMPPQAVSF